MKIKKSIYIAALSVLGVGSVIAQEKQDSLKQVKDSTYIMDSILASSLNKINDQKIADDILLTSEFCDNLDSLSNVRFFTNEHFTTDTAILNKYNFSASEIPHYADSIYEQRVEELNRMTTINLTYNRTVQNFINLYAVKKRGLTSRVLGLAEIYFPMFEEHLDKYNLPQELKYLAVVESALHPKAGSRAGAKGLWQFMYYTGKSYGLQANTLIDDRFDPLKSTIAACEHLEDLYGIYGDWMLALAAYNSGAGNVNKAIRRAGRVKNYWAVWPFLPRETRGYVPAFIAVNYIMNYSSEHNIYPEYPGILYSEIDTVHVKDLLHFDQISELLHIPMKDIKYLNPQFKQQIIPATAAKPHVLRIPRSFVADFIDYEDSIYNHKTKRGIAKAEMTARLNQLKSRDVHIVRSGQTLGHIANRYRTSVSNIKRWNGLKSNLIRPGQRLIVYANPHMNSKKKKSIKNTNGVHVVRSGETLGEIAKLYKISVNQLKSWNNLTSSTIYASQKLKVRS